jgi:hypothetical protein
MAEPARKRAEKIVARRTPGRKVPRSKKDTAKALASMIEQHLTDLGLPAEEKNRRVARFSERVDKATESHARS